MSSNFDTALLSASVALSPTQQAVVSAAAAAAGASAAALIAEEVAAAAIAAGASLQDVLSLAVAAGLAAGAEHGVAAGTKVDQWLLADNSIGDRGSPWPGVGATELTTSGGESLGTPSSESHFSAAPDGMTAKPFALTKQQ